VQPDVPFWRVVDGKRKFSPNARAASTASASETLILGSKKCRHDWNYGVNQSGLPIIDRIRANRAIECGKFERLHFRRYASSTL
jgi:hypothetical protein